MAEFIQTVTAILTDAITPIYINTQQKNYIVQIARGITITNITNDPQVIIYCVNKIDEEPPKGAIFYGLTVDPGETISPGDKAVPLDYCIRAYSAASGVFSFVCDIYSP